MTKPISSDWYRLNFQFSAQFEWRDMQLYVSWAPRCPRRHEMRRVLDTYRTARDAFLGQVTLSTGLTIKAVEVPL